MTFRISAECDPSSNLDTAAARSLRYACMTTLRILPLCLAFLAATAAAQQATNAPRGSPKLVCDQPSFEFGELDESATVTHAFVLRNAGTAPLIIRRVRATCGCFAANLQDHEIPPGGQTTLETSFPLRARRGAQSKSISIESNDPAMPYYTVWMIGVVTTEVALDPQYLNFGIVEARSNAMHDVKLLTRRPEVVITNLTCDSPYFRAKIFEEAGRRGKGFTMQTVPPLPSGQSRTTITVFTDHPDRRQVTLTAVAYVPPEIRVLPMEIILLRSTPRPVTRTIVLYPGTVTNFTVLSVEKPVDSTQITLQQPSPGTYRIDVDNLSVSPGIEGKSLRILTDVPAMKEIVIPIKLVD